MPTSYTGGLNFSWPSVGDTNWWSTINTALTAISAHDHTASGKGLKIGSNGISANAVNSTHILLAQNTSLRGVDAAGTGTIELIKNSGGNGVEFPTIRGDASVDSITVSSNITVPSTTTTSILTPSANGYVCEIDTASVSGQTKIIYNASASKYLFINDPVFSTNIIQLMPKGACVLRWYGAWIPSSVTNGALLPTSFTITADSPYTATQERVLICNKAAALAVTLDNGFFDGQELYVVNIGAGTATITPSTSAGLNTAALTTNGNCLYVWLSNEWRVFAGQNCTIS